MESSLHQVWESAAGSPFVPIVGKDSQFLVGITLLTLGLLLSGFFGLSEYDRAPNRASLITYRPHRREYTTGRNPSFVSNWVSKE